MDLEKLTKDFAKNVGELAFNKKEKSSETIKVNKLDSDDVFKIIFNKAVHEGNYNKAENLIFDELKKNNSSEIYEIAIEFYNSLLKKSDEELNKSDFTREEISSGLKDIKHLLTLKIKNEQ